MHSLSTLLLCRTLTQYALESDESFPILLKTESHFWLLTVSPRNRCHQHHFFQSLSMYLTGSPLMVRSSSSVSKKNCVLPFLRLMFGLCSIIISWLTAAAPFCFPSGCAQAFLACCMSTHMHVSMCRFMDVISSPGWATPHEFRSGQTFHKGVSSLHVAFHCWHQC